MHPPAVRVISRHTPERRLGPLYSSEQTSFASSALVIAAPA